MSLNTTTYDCRVRTALLWKQNTIPWIAVGRTAVWANEQNPPDPSPGATDIEEAIVFAKATNVKLCKPVTEGEDITVDGQKYAYVDDEDAYTEYARYVFVEATLDPAVMPYANYRQKGIFADLVPVAGHEADTWLAPADVSDVGHLLYLANKTVKSYGPGETRIERTVIEFRA